MLNSKTVIIVSEPKKEIKKVAHYLYNLIGTIGECDAAIWEDKHYRDNEPTLPSSQSVVFIGETETSKMMLDSIEWSYNELNMRAGWIGRRAVIYVERKNLQLDEYDAFKAKFKKQDEEVKETGFFGFIKRTDEVLTKSSTKLKIAGLFIPYLWPAAAYALIKQRIDSNKIIEQQYSYVVNKFIGEHAMKFLG